MKIGIDCRMYSPAFTGIGRYVLELTENLFKLDKQNEYVLFFNNPEYKYFKPPNERVKKVLVDAGHYSFAEQTTFLKKLNKEKLDLMHFTHFNAPLLYNKPFIVTIHDLTLTLFPGQKMTNFTHRMAYHAVIKHAVKKAKHVIAVSNNTKNDLGKFLKADTNKVSVVYEGIAPEFKPIKGHKLELVRGKYDIQKPFLLYTGVFRSHKNLVNLVKAFAVIRKNYKLDIQLVITGREDKYYPEVKNTIEQLGLQNEIVMPGLVPEEDLISLYSTATIYVFPSLYEGFGLPPLEAMQCGTPVVCSNASCMPEVCGDAVLFFNPNDLSDIAEKVHTLYKDKNLQKKLIKKGLEHVQKFSWEKMAKETLKLYNSVA
ncbi:MAG: glycosyltransferase family 1 protein [Patescibacteria group bacterium]|nr:glycosyltransferase family 4 protein [Patescibacteria group bacterium]